MKDTGLLSYSPLISGITTGVLEAVSLTAVPVVALDVLDELLFFFGSLAKATLSVIASGDAMIVAITIRARIVVVAFVLGILLILANILFIGRPYLYQT
jgi:hypothetical protein